MPRGPALALAALIAACDEAPDPVGDTAAFAPDWSAIAVWPATDPLGGEASPLAVAAVPDAGRLTVMMVLDDSSSMERDIEDAKDALVEAAALLPKSSHLGVTTLNGGVVIDPAPAREVKGTLRAAIAGVRADGSTPLGPALQHARALLERQAAGQRSFGTYRIVVATDGAADDAEVLGNVVAALVTETPIQLSTIGIGVGEGHALNIPGVTDYVGLGGVDGLATALAAAVAENPTFEPIAAFETDEEET